MSSRTIDEQRWLLAHSFAEEAVEAIEKAGNLSVGDKLREKIELEIYNSLGVLS
jgi:hypothetical protein